MNNRTLMGLVATLLVLTPASAFWGLSQPPIKVSQESTGFFTQLFTVSGSKKLIVENTGTDVLRNIEIRFTILDGVGKTTEVRKTVIARLEPGKIESMTAVEGGMFVPNLHVEFRADGFGDPLVYVVRE